MCCDTTVWSAQSENCRLVFTRVALRSMVSVRLHDSGNKVGMT
jgi:hypothetical protein